METPFSLFNMPTTSQPQEPTDIISQPDPTTDPPNKKTKGRPRKKDPQRGMGVAQLERLRLQEMRKNSQQLDFYYPTLNLPPQPLPDPIQSFPVHYGSPVNFYGMNLNVNGCGGGSLGWDQNVGFKRVENGGGFGFNGRVVGSGPVLVSNPYCVNDPIMRFVENSNNNKELSSVPNVLVSTLQQHDSSRCDLCFKKKMLINGDQDVGHNGRRSNFSPQISPTNGPDFLGLNLDRNINFNGNKSNGGSFSSRVARSAVQANHNLTEGMDVVAIHRKGNSMRGGGGGVFMEYDFFPRSKNSDHINYGIMKSTASKERELLGSSEASEAVGSGGGGGEASCVTVCDYSSFQSSNSIDLSLKLS